MLLNVIKIKMGSQPADLHLSYLKKLRGSTGPTVCGLLA